MNAAQIALDAVLTVAMAEGVVLAWFVGRWRREHPAGPSPAAPRPRGPAAPRPRGPGRRTFRALLAEARRLNDRVDSLDLRRADEFRTAVEIHLYAERVQTAVRDASREAFGRVEPPKPREGRDRYLARLDALAKSYRRRTRGPGEG